MGGVSRLLIVTGLIVAFGATSALAAIPDPSQSTVPNVVMNTAGNKAYTVTVIGGDGSPLQNSLVKLIFSAEVDSVVCWCVGQAHPEITALTDVNGEATFNIAGGGCFDPSQWANPPVSVFADGVLLDEVGALATDSVDDVGLLPHQGWNPGGTCSAGLPDAVFHTNPIQTGTYSFCSDFNSDGAVGLDDAVFITNPIQSGDFCNAQ
jgi:hypothetical protein